MMTSFTKVCVDISNNLKNLRFNKSPVNKKNSDKNAESIPQDNQNTGFIKSSEKFVDKLLDVYLSSNESNDLRNHSYNYISVSAHSSPVIQRSYRSNHRFPSSNNPHRQDESQTESDEEKFSNPYSETLKTCKTSRINEQDRPKPIKMPPFSPTLSHRVLSLAQKVSELNSPKQRTGYQSVTSSPILSPRGTTVNAIKQRLFSQGMRVDLGNGSCSSSFGTPSNRFRDYFRRHLYKKKVTLDNLFLQEAILQRIFSHLSGKDLLNCCLVTKLWMELLVRERFYERIRLMIDFRKTQRLLSNCPTSTETQIEAHLTQILRAGVNRNIRELRLVNLIEKDVDILTNCLQNCKDFFDSKTLDSDETPKQIPPSASTDSTDSNISENSLSSTQSSSSGIGSSLGSCGKNLQTKPLNEEANSCRSSISVKTIIPITNDGPEEVPLLVPMEQKFNQQKLLSHPFYDSLSIYNSSVLDMSLEQIIRLFIPLRSLHLQCCNEISEICLWNILQPTIRTLTVYDCINISDESFAAICQLLPNLQELNLQAYHVTNRAMAYFSNEQREKLKTLRIVQCMELNNQGFISLAQMLNNLTYLSLFGCSKITDDGLDIICENFKHLEYLDLSWCVKLTDGGLECVACDLVQLKTLKLDKCFMITDAGIRHLINMKSLEYLTLRWCGLITDSSIIHLLGVHSLTFISLSGCKRLTSQGLGNLIKHKSLRILELANCPSADPITRRILKQNISNCILLT